MIPSPYITDWRNFVPWQTSEQVEQDLIICRALVEIFNDEFLSEHLAFRGGTALHKLYLQPQPRYSEDIDLVQIKAGPIKDVLGRLQERLSFLGSSSVQQKNSNNTIKFRFLSEVEPVQNLRLKIETNCREHFAELGWEKKTFSVESEWFSGKCNITTYRLEELLGTKLRALYQRRKGRDMFDLYKALTHAKPDVSAIIQCYKTYMEFSVGKAPSQKEFLGNMEAKMQNPEFIGDITGLLRPDEKYDHEQAYEYIKKELLEKI